MRYTIIKNGSSLSFPDGDGFHANASSIESADIIIYSGVTFKPDPTKAAILIELGNECLAEHVGDAGEHGHANVMDFGTLPDIVMGEIRPRSWSSWSDSRTPANRQSLRRRSCSNKPSFRL
jgi:hypothetical protein